MRKYQLSSWVIFRHILAVIHFNYNLRRKPIVNKSDKSERLKISYLKFKNGEATFRSVRVAQNFGKCLFFIHKSIGESLQYSASQIPLPTSLATSPYMCIQMPTAYMAMQLLATWLRAISDYLSTWLPRGSA